MNEEPTPQPQEVSSAVDDIEESGNEDMFADEPEDDDFDDDGEEGYF